MSLCGVVTNIIADFYGLLLLHNYTDSIAKEAYLDSNELNYAKSHFQKIIDYKDSLNYILLIDDKRYADFYNTCSNRNGYIWYVINDPEDASSHFQTTCQRGISGTSANIDFSPFELWLKLNEMGLIQSEGEHYTFARMIGMWESTDKKIRMEVYRDKSNVLMIQLNGLVFSQSKVENGERFAMQDTYVMLKMRENKIVISYYFIEDFAKIEFLDNSTLKFTTLKNDKTYILNLKGNN